MNSIRQELQRIRQSVLARNTGWMMAGQGVGVVLQAVYFVVLARLLGVTQYGVFVGAFAFTTIVAQYSTLGTGTVLLRYVSTDRQKFAAYWGNVLVVTLGLGTVLVLGLHLVAPDVLDPASASVVLLAAIANCLCMQVVAVAGNVFQAFEQLQMTALLSLMINLARTVAAFLMLLTMHRETAWQWAAVSTTVSALAAGVALMMVTVKFGLPEVIPRMMARHGLEGFGYSFAGSTTTLYNDLDKTMLSHYGLNFANGVYTMAYRIVDMAAIPITSMHAAALPQFFKRGSSSLSHAAELSYKLLKRGSMLGVVAAAVMFVAAPLIPHMAGSGFQQSVSALRWLCLIPIFRSVHLMTGSALTGAGLQRYRTAAQMAAVALNFGLNVWLIPSHGWTGAAWASLATDGALAVMNWALLRLLTVRSERRVLCLNVNS